MFSKPYSDFFCSSSSCCRLCLHTKHLKDKKASSDKGIHVLGAGKHFNSRIIKSPTSKA